MKREHTDDDRYGSSRNSKRQRADGFSEALAQGKFELRVLVSSKCAGAIIGKGGENIKRLRNQFEGQISVPDSNSPERVLTLVCPSSVIVRIVEDILPRIEDTQNERDKCTIRLLVHQSHAGALIGRQGLKIKELRDRTNARIKVFQQCCPQSTDRIAMISGDDRNVIDAVEHIVDELKQIPIKGPVNPYTSFNYDPALAPDYGGFSPSYPGGRGPPAISPFAGGSSRRPGIGAPISLRGGLGPDMRFERALAREFDTGPYGSPIGGPQYGGHLSYGGYPGQNSIQTTQVTIPSDLGGTIIGRGGDRINRIREESGAQIQLEPSTGQEERVITITGTQTQIHAAQYLLQQCVRQSAAGRKYIEQQQAGHHHHR
ncbi:KH domain protein [Dictyocaulus viviparus]|uniref:KH domain protein n=1 Tax=Dictyocaulus viviparus TaxID=29172 RepID=A0A0D8Y4B2_DICVI|nr:KH domain protein [Dictyocaulus viviparus]